MAARVQIPFIGPQSVSRNILVNNQETVNFMHAIKGQGAKAPVILESGPGMVVIDTPGDGPLRSPKMLPSKIRTAATKPELYGVYGSKLIAQTCDQGMIEIGTLNTSAFDTKCRIARGRNYILVVDGTNGYTYDGTTFAVITDPDFPSNPTHCVYIDGFFVVNDSDTDNFFISASEDPTSWNALDFEVAAVAPDAGLALAATEALLWIVGDETAQAFYNTGNPDFPYEIVLNATQEVGIEAPQSIAESDDGIFYLATTPEGGSFVYQIRETVGRKISGDEQEAFLDTVTDRSTAYGYIYKQSGKSFYVLQLGATGGDDPRSSSTLVYNIGAQAWERRELTDGTAWRAAGHGILGGKNVVGSRLAAQNLRLDLDVYMDAGAPLIRRRRTQIVHHLNHTLNFWKVIIDLKGGVGNDDEPNPVLKLRYSNDGGQTWSYWLEHTLGAVGETLTQIVFSKLGSGKNRLFEVECADPVMMDIIAAYAEVEVTAD